ncbi:MotA/TolQ/ExbB proton channel family protein [Oceanispirochaeta sp.]|jgi:flagellar motor component MotA|uniref:MotA/TolQ/ExbB proton channel family protein n=1 Tax=Oceanispirochaeta sp. TaxID=2035350 RepID=UPI00261F947B|nr:MotA/TolQ/ExbB proton channel family protein [Oceanispirochaeta sp.]MDA3958315.1 MotA/TolQ/ExbB proton channel family protein [Oceanispirochaeta sp.]
MKKLHYFIYVILFFVIFGAILWSTETAPYIFIDIASLLIILLFLMLLTVFQIGIKQTILYYKAVFDPTVDSETAKAGSRYFSTLSLYTLGTGMLGFLTGIMVVLAYYMEDTKYVGPNMAVALITLFYSVFFCLLIFLPFKMVLDSKARNA